MNLCWSVIKILLGHRDKKILQSFVFRTLSTGDWVIRFSIFVRSSAVSKYISNVTFYRKDFRNFSFPVPFRPWQTYPTIPTGICLGRLPVCSINKHNIGKRNSPRNKTSTNQRMQKQNTIALSNARRIAKQSTYYSYSNPIWKLLAIKVLSNFFTFAWLIWVSWLA